MSAANDDSLNQVQGALATWRSTHPRATLAEIEVAVEEQIERLRGHLIKEQTEAGFAQGAPNLSALRHDDEAAGHHEADARAAWGSAAGTGAELRRLSLLW